MSFVRAAFGPSYNLIQIKTKNVCAGATFHKECDSTTLYDSMSVSSRSAVVIGRPNSALSIF